MTKTAVMITSHAFALNICTCNEWCADLFRVCFISRPDRIKVPYSCFWILLIKVNSYDNPGLQVDRVCLMRATYILLSARKMRPVQIFTTQNCPPDWWERWAIQHFPADKTHFKSYEDCSPRKQWAYYKAVYLAQDPRDSGSKKPRSFPKTAWSGQHTKTKVFRWNYLGQVETLRNRGLYANTILPLKNVYSDQTIKFYVFIKDCVNIF